MNFSIALLSALCSIASVSAFDTASASGAQLMAKARALGNNNNQWVDYSWVQNYAIRFQSCTTISQFNTFNNNKNQYSPINKANIAKFELCPTKSCSAKCVGAEYVVGAGDFANYYTDHLMTTRQYNCELIRQNCVCQDGQDQDTCQSGCYTSANATYCVQMNNNQFNIQNYMQCNKVKFQNNNNNNNNGNNNNNNNNQYYAAPKCASDGKGIVMGLFTDQFCTIDADYSVYSQFESSYGFPLPHSTTDLVEEQCVSCSYNNNGNAQTAQLCSTLYLAAGKCETNLKGQISSPIETDCQFMSELATKKDGYTVPKHTNWAAIFFAFTTFSLLGLLVYVSFKAGIVRKKVDLGTRDGLMA